MKKTFIVSIELPAWADNPDQWENIRSEIEQHAGAAAAFYTRATHVSARCEALPLGTRQKAKEAPAQ